jgi:FAD-dependent urate hydroxylase
MAAALRRRGLTATLFEKAPGPEQLTVGAGVNLMQPAVTVMKAEGMWEGENGVGTCNLPSSTFFFHDAGNDSTVRAVDLAARYGSPYYTVRRGDVTRALLATLPGDGPQYGLGVAGIDDTDSTGVRLRFEDATVSEAAYDAVIGADGISSALRTYVLGSADAPEGADALPQKESAVVNIIGICPTDALCAAEPALASAMEARKGFCVHLDPAMTFILASVSTTHVMWSVSVNTDLFPRGCDDGDAALRSALAAHMESSEPPPSPFVRTAMTACLAHTPPAPHADAAYLWRLRDTGPLPTIVRGRVALIGDAAHPALP